MRIVLGKVDINGRCTPLREDVIIVKPRLVLTKIRIWGIPLPALRQAIRLGIFLENSGRQLPRIFPRLILEVICGDIPIRIRPRRHLYRMVENIHGGNLYMAQMYQECVIHPRNGVYLGFIDFEYPLFRMGKRFTLAARVHSIDYPIAEPQDDQIIEIRMEDSI